jgi:DNA-binding MarR family transcriptional regulator
MAFLNTWTVMNPASDFNPDSPQGGGLGYLITQARNAVLAAIESELATLDVTAAQFIVVLGIAHGRAATPSEIARLVGCDSGAMTRLLDRIEGKGIIRRSRSNQDRRIVHIELTSKGRELHPRIMASVAKVHAQILRPFSSVEIGQLEALLRKIASMHDEKNLIT